MNSTTMNTGIVKSDDQLERIKSAYANTVKSVLPELEELYYLLPLEQVRVDSIDLITLRAEFERMNLESIPDEKWINFATLDEMINYCADVQYRNSKANGHFSKEGQHTGYLTINMPQMAIGTLSESWLFKEIGNRHWEMLCKGLNTPSDRIKNQGGERLYATFVRIQISGTASLGVFGENDRLAVNENIERFGEGMYFSKIHLSGEECTFRCRLMTSFSVRNSNDNTALAKSQPAVAVNNVEALPDLPAFANEYRNMKKGLKDCIVLGNEEMYITGDVISETEYIINPYYDLNGVGLLYFAAYPIISDNCEAQYFNENRGNTPRWETGWATQHRDIFYYGNCNIDDTIIYRLHAVNYTKDGGVFTYSSLSRKKDDVRISQIFTIKAPRLME